MSTSGQDPDGATIDEQCPDSGNNSPSPDPGNSSNSPPKDSSWPNRPNSSDDSSSSHELFPSAKSTKAAAATPSAKSTKAAAATSKLAAASKSKSSAAISSKSCTKSPAGTSTAKSPAATTFKSPTGLTVPRTRTPNTGATSMSGMTDPSPDTTTRKPKTTRTRKKKIAAATTGKDPPKKRGDKKRKHALKSAPPLPAADAANAIGASMPAPAQGQEEEEDPFPEPTSQTARTDPLPFAQCTEARVDGEFKSGADVTFNSDSEDEEDWEGDLGEEECNDHLGKTREDFSVKPDCSSSDVGGANATETEDAPPGWKPHGPKPDWKPSKPKKSEGEPASKDVDNPGKWPEFVFGSKFRDGNGKIECQRHMPMTGCTPVPAVKSGPCKDKRVRGGWNFNCEGTWVSDAKNASRDGADEDEMFPKCRRGKPCVVTLKKTWHDEGTHGSSFVEWKTRRSVL